MCDKLPDPSCCLTSSTASTAECLKKGGTINADLCNILNSKATPDTCRAEIARLARGVNSSADTTETTSTDTKKQTFMNLPIWAITLIAVVGVLIIILVIWSVVSRFMAPPVTVGGRRIRGGRK